MKSVNFFLSKNSKIRHFFICNSFVQRKRVTLKNIFFLLASSSSWRSERMEKINFKLNRYWKLDNMNVKKMEWPSSSVSNKKITDKSWTRKNFKHFNVWKKCKWLVFDIHYIRNIAIIVVDETDLMPIHKFPVWTTHEWVMVEKNLFSTSIIIFVSNEKKSNELLMVLLNWKNLWMFQLEPSVTREWKKCVAKFLNHHQTLWTTTNENFQSQITMADTFKMKD